MNTNNLSTVRVSLRQNSAYKSLRNIVLVVEAMAYLSSISMIFVAVAGNGGEKGIIKGIIFAILVSSITCLAARCTNMFADIADALLAKHQTATSRWSERP